MRVQGPNSGWSALLASVRYSLAPVVSAPWRKAYGVVVRTSRQAGPLALCCLALSVAALTSTGCSAKRADGAIMMSTIRPELPGTKSRELEISSRELQNALARAELVRKLRMIQLYKSVSEFEQEIPEYRLFGITPGSPYALLGLENADVLVAANDYVVRNPSAFVQYIGVLPGEKSAFIEVRRSGEPLILRYKIR